MGNFSSGMVGEVADETHIANEIEYLGNRVKRIPRDIWKAYVDGENNWPDLTNDLHADVNIICKWNAFDKPDYIEVLKYRSQAPVFYWIWDYMFYNGMPPWHMAMATTADLYLSNELGVANKYYGACKFYYFPFDVSDAAIDKVFAQKKYDVTFFGSYLDQGDRAVWIPEINKMNPVKVFSWNFEEWKKLGIDAEPPVWGQNFSQKVAESKIILGFNVEDHCWGYWSNRVGKVLSTGGFLLQRYVPGMELFLRNGCEYFSSIDEANKKIKYYLEHNTEREKIAQIGYEIGRNKFTSRARIKELIILCERYVQGGFNESPA